MPISLSGSAIHNELGVLLGIVFIAQDMRQTRELQAEITERQKMDQSLIEAKEVAEAAKLELQEANRRLQELDQMKSDFLSTVSHELRTSLTSILGFAKIIKKRLEDVIFPIVESNDKKVESATIFRIPFD